MSGQGHQFPGGFPNNPAMRSNFGSGPMGPAMPGSMSNQLSGVMGGQMGAVGGMVGMGTQMGQAYNPNIQNQMGNMPGMPPQSMAIASSTPSPNQGMGGMGMGASIGTGAGMAGGMSGQGMGSAMATGGMGTNIGINTSGMAGGAMTGNPALVNNVVANTSATISQNSAGASQANQVANQPQQNKEFNTASLCRFGQETVQDIVSRTQEVFQTLKAIQPPNGTSQGANTSNEKKAKIQEQLRTIRLLFKRLRLIYEKCNENCQVPGMEYTHIESLIPLKEEYEHKTIDEKKTSEAYKVVCEENRELTEQVVLKNKQLKEVINNLRTIIWEINVMLTMRRS